MLMYIPVDLNFPVEINSWYVTIMNGTN